MTQYFYLTSSLPGLIWGEAPPISSEELRERCGDILSEDAMLIFDATGLVPSEEAALPEGSLAARYAVWETSLRNALLPSLSKSRDYAKYRRLERDAFSEMDDIVATVTQAHNPLEAEQALDYARWQEVELLEGGESFTLNSLCAYKLKLLLLEKYSDRTPERGEKHIDEILQALGEKSRG